jgi:hypothetical protein
VRPSDHPEIGSIPPARPPSRDDGAAPRRRATSAPDSAPTRDIVHPAEAAAAMATVVARLRRMAATLFRGDAALFEDSARH